MEAPALAQRLERGAYTAAATPFFHFELEPFLPDARYRALAASFPGTEWFPEIIQGNKRRLNQRARPEAFAAFRRALPVWDEFFAALASPAFLDALHRIVHPGLRAVRGALGARRWRTLEAPFDPRRRRVIVTLELSRLEAGSWVVPHTDAPEKLATMMLYFADPDWQPEWGGDTFYARPIDPALRRNWFNQNVSFEAVQPFFRNPFRPNRLAVFVKSRDSYHAVAPIHCPPDRARNSLNVNVFAADPVFEPLVAWRDRRGRKRERRSYPAAAVDPQALANPPGAVLATGEAP